MKTTLLSGLSAIALIAAAPAAYAETVIITDVTAHTGGEAGVIEDADIIIDDGAISEIGVDLVAPEGARAIDGSDKIVTAGIVASFSHLGLTEVGLSANANDAATQSSFGLGAAIDIQYAVNMDSTAVAVARQGGVTHAVVAPEFATGVFAGQGAIVSLAETDGGVIKPQAGLFAALGSAGARLEGGTRATVWTVLRESLDDARTYTRNQRLYSISRERDQRLPLSDIRSIATVLAGDQPLVIFADRASDLREIIKLKSDYEIDVIVLGARQGWRVAEALAEAEIPVVMSPLANLPHTFDALGATLENAARLSAAGVTVAFYNENVSVTHDLRSLRHVAGVAVANGMDYGAALKALTAAPAQVWGLGDGVGVIAAGAPANLVVWSGDPFELTTHAEHVFIDGEQVSLESRQSLLRDRYSDLERGDLPFAYRGAVTEAELPIDASPSEATPEVGETEGPATPPVEPTEDGRETEAAPVHDKDEGEASGEDPAVVPEPADATDAAAPEAAADEAGLPEQGSPAPAESEDAAQSGATTASPDEAEPDETAPPAAEAEAEEPGEAPSPPSEPAPIVPPETDESEPAEGPQASGGAEGANPPAGEAEEARTAPAASPPTDTPGPAVDGEGAGEAPQSEATDEPEGEQPG